MEGESEDEGVPLPEDDPFYAAFPRASGACMFFLLLVLWCS